MNHETPAYGLWRLVVINAAAAMADAHHARDVSNSGDHVRETGSSRGAGSSRAVRRRLG